MGVSKTVLLPVGTRPGLTPGAGGNQSAVDLARKYPREFVFFANAVPEDPNAEREIARHLKAGALGIGEQKYSLECDSRPMQRIFAIAQEHQIPVLLHFQHGAFNMGIERFHKMVEKYPKAKFIGHAQTWWGNIDRNHDQKVMYPKGRVTPGGITDRLLSDYKNVFADSSAGSGLTRCLETKTTPAISWRDIRTDHVWKRLQRQRRGWPAVLRIAVHRHAEEAGAFGLRVAEDAASECRSDRDEIVITAIFQDRPGRPPSHRQNPRPETIRSTISPNRPLINHER